MWSYKFKIIGTRSKLKRNSLQRFDCHSIAIRSIEILGPVLELGRMKISDRIFEFQFAYCLVSAKWLHICPLIISDSLHFLVSFNLQEWNKFQQKVFNVEATIWSLLNIIYSVDIKLLIVYARSLAKKQKLLPMFW